VLTSRHGAGTSGAATSGISIEGAFVSPMRWKKSFCRSVPASSAIFTEPMLDEYMKTSAIVSQRRFAW
jgi:hypothetical protein